MPGLTMKNVWGRINEKKGGRLQISSPPLENLLNHYIDCSRPFLSLFDIKGYLITFIQRSETR